MSRVCVMGTKIDMWQRVVVLFAIKGEGSGCADEMGLTLDGVLSVLSRYPDISAEWLMRGTGSMYLSSRDGESSATYNLDVSRHSVEGSGNVLSSGQSAGGALVDALGRMAESLDRVAGMLCRLEAEHERRRGEQDHGWDSHADGHPRPALRGAYGQDKQDDCGHGQP